MDLKTTGGSASAGVWGRGCFERGYDLQASFYCRGVEMVRGEPPDGMLFVVVEQQPPHAIAVYRMSSIALDIADQKVRAGISLWQNCIATGLWPPYSIETQSIDPPVWVVRDWESRGALSARSQERIREQREIPIGVEMVEQDDFGG